MTQPWLLKIVAKMLSANTTIELFSLNVSTRRAVAWFWTPVWCLKIFSLLLLQGTNIGPEGANVLASPLGRNKTLHTVSLRTNGIGDSGCNAIVDALMENDTVKELCLERNLLSDQG